MSPLPAPPLGSVDTTHLLSSSTEIYRK